MVLAGLTCVLGKVLVQLGPVSVLGDVPHEQSVVVVRDGYSHLATLAYFTTIELDAVIAARKRQSDREGNDNHHGGKFQQKKNTSTRKKVQKKRQSTRLSTVRT